MVIPWTPSRDLPIRLAECWVGSSHVLADAARVLLSLIGFVEEGVRGATGAEGLRERLGLLRGAVMSAGTAVRLPGVGMMMDSGRWDDEWLKRLGR